MNRKTAHFIICVDALSISAVDNLKRSEIVMSCRVVDRKCPHVILMDKCLGVKDKGHVNKQSPRSIVTSDLVESQLPCLHIGCFCELWTFVQDTFHHRPVLVLDFTEQCFKGRSICDVDNLPLGLNRRSWSHASFFDGRWGWSWKLTRRTAIFLFGLFLLKKSNVMSRFASAIRGLDGYNRSNNISFVHQSCSCAGQTPSILNDRGGISSRNKNFRDKQPG
mmetsp:Transcript_40558/g.84413  ORF Transcript_40558/g.84413 Transcript_40558/m.84413 type:complete len:221 (+) Transcript_40558:2340-3002(+)